MTKLTKEEVLKIYDRVFHYHFQQPHQINNILTVASEIQDAYQAKNADQLRDAERYRWLRDKHDDGDEQWFVYGAKAQLDSAIDSAMKESK